MILTIVVSSGWSMYQIDVYNAFLHRNLQEHVFMLQTSGYHPPQFPNHVCHFYRSLYGLCQAPRVWFSRLTNKLLTCGLLVANKIFLCSSTTRNLSISSCLSMLMISSSRDPPLQLSLLSSISSS